MEADKKTGTRIGTTGVSRGKNGCCRFVWKPPIEKRGAPVAPVGPLLSTPRKGT